MTGLLATPGDADAAARTAKDPPPRLARRFDPDEIAALEAERDFVLTSLDDLDAAHAAGDLDEGDYRRLCDDYTARAAAVARSLQDGWDRRPARVRPSWRHRVLVGSAVTAFAVGAALLANSTMGLRLPGQSVSGNDQIDPANQRALEQAVRQRPKDPDAHRALAQARLTNRDLLGALEAFDTAARLDPRDPAPRAYGGWIVYQAGLVDEALKRLAAASAADPAYPDAHLFRGIILLRSKNDPAGAAAEFERYLAAVPAGPLDRKVRGLLEDARKLAATTPSSR